MPGFLFLSLEKFQKLVFVQNLYAEFLGFVVFTAEVNACHGKTCVF